jgi:hypothetical protein
VTVLSHHPGRRHRGGEPAKIALGLLKLTVPQRRMPSLLAMFATELKQAYPARWIVEQIVGWTATSRGRRIKMRLPGRGKETTAG